jgi:hypothetical protein
MGNKMDNRFHNQAFSTRFVVLDPPVAIFGEKSRGKQHSWWKLLYSLAVFPLNQ